jgi:hypothetical protein
VQFLTTAGILLELFEFSSNRNHRESRAAVAEAREQFWNLEERKRPPLEAITSRMVMREQEEKAACVL